MVPCECCAGSGQRRLRPKESIALAAVSLATGKGDDAWATTGSIAAVLPKKIGRGALLYRLAHLEQLGLLESRGARAAEDILTWFAARTPGATPDSHSVQHSNAHSGERKDNR